MTSVSAYINGVNVNVVNVVADGSNYYVTYVDGNNNFRIKREFLETSGSTIGTSAKVN